MTWVGHAAVIALVAATASGCAARRAVRTTPPVSRAEASRQDRISDERPTLQPRRDARAGSLAAFEPIPSSDSSPRLAFKFAAGTATREVLTFIAESGGISVNVENTFVDSKIPSAIDLDGVTVEQALNVVTLIHGLFYKALSPTAILVVPDTPQNRQKYDELVVRTVRLAHTDAAEMATMLAPAVAGQGQQLTRPQIHPDKGANTITIRGTVPQVVLVEQIIANTDRPLAEVVVDIEILEVDRSRAKTYGVNLSAFLIGVQYAPTSGASTAAAAGAIGLDAILGGVSATDFQGTVPSVILRFLEADSRTRVVARPTLRGAEGTKLTASLGDDVPVPSTTFQAMASGGTGASPMASFTYRSVGVNISATPRVTSGDDIILDLEVESSASSGSVNVGGQELPTFASRKVKTRMRLRNGESSLLAGLIHDADRRALAGIPGTIHVPVVRRLFAANDRRIDQTEMVMIVTPHIVRTRQLTERNLAPVVIR